MASTPARSPAATRPRAAHLGPEKRRPLILDAAFEVFLEHGYDGASMDAVARAAGVTKPVVYACFASKEELFAELLTREEQRMLALIAAALPAHADENPERTLATGLTAFLQAVADSPQAFKVILLGEGANAAVALRVARGRSAQVDAIAMLAEAWLEQRDVAEPEQPARLIAHALVGVAESAARALLSEPERWEPGTMGPMLARLITEGQGALRSVAAPASRRHEA